MRACVTSKDAHMANVIVVGRHRQVGTRRVVEKIAQSDRVLDFIISVMASSRTILLL